MNWESAWAEAAMARRFVLRLSELGEAESRPAIPPILHGDPYLSAWTNVEAALGNAPARDQVRVRALAAELDVQVDALDMLPSLREAARRAVLALLVRRWLLTPESLAFVYEPFESSIPLTTLVG